MTAEKTERDEELRELWGLLFSEPEELDDDQLERLLEAREALGDLLARRNWRFPSRLTLILKYRTRKRELAKLPTEQLEERLKAILRERNAFYSFHEDEDIPDSFFEPPPIDSDERILSLLLRERREVKAQA